jgi:hypothetical protein
MHSTHYTGTIAGKNVAIVSEASTKKLSAWWLHLAKAQFEKTSLEVDLVDNTTIFVQECYKGGFRISLNSGSEELVGRRWQNKQPAWKVLRNGVESLLFRFKDLHVVGVAQGSKYLISTNLRSSLLEKLVLLIGHKRSGTRELDKYPLDAYKHLTDEPKLERFHMRLFHMLPFRAKRYTSDLLAHALLFGPDPVTTPTYVDFSKPIPKVRIVTRKEEILSPKRPELLEHPFVKKAFGWLFTHLPTRHPA